MQKTQRTLDNAVVLAVVLFHFPRILIARPTTYNASPKEQIFTEMCYTKVIHSRDCGHFYYTPQHCPRYPNRCILWRRQGEDLDGQCFACSVERRISPHEASTVIERKAEERITNGMSLVAEATFAEELRLDPSCRASLKRRIPQLRALSNLQSNFRRLVPEWEVTRLTRFSEITTRLEHSFNSGERTRRGDMTVQNHHLNPAFTILEAMEIMIFHPRHAAVGVIFFELPRYPNSSLFADTRNDIISVDLGSLPEDERECSVCKDQYGFASDDGQIPAEFPVKLVRCSHVFGQHCLERWLEGQKSCPYCRRDPFA